MGTHNICLYKEVDKKYTGYNLKTMELLDCALIGVCAVIRLNTVFSPRKNIWILLLSEYPGNAFCYHSTKTSWVLIRSASVFVEIEENINPGPAEPGYTLSLQCRSRSEEAN